MSSETEYMLYHVEARTAMIVVAKCIHYHDVTEDGEPQILGHTNQQ